MARGEHEKHWLLRRQLQGHPEDHLPMSFLQSVNRAYRVFDDNYLRIKLLLRRKVLQLVESNAMLQKVLSDRDSQINADRQKVEKLIYNLHRAEVIANLGSFTWYAGMRVGEFSDNLYQLIGLERREQRASAILRMFDNPLEILHALRKANEVKNVVKLENLKLHNQARYFDFEAHITFDNQAQIVTISGVVKENTQWVNVNNRVDDQKKFYEAILNNLPVDIAIFNYDHKYLYINSKAVKNEEVRDYLIGRDDFDYCLLRGIDASKAKARREVFEKVRDSKEIIEFEDSSESEDGSFKYISRRFVPVLNSLGDFSFMLGYGVDVTKLKQQELVLGRSLREKELLLGEIHHGVKNNLTLIVALLEINSVHEKDALVKKYFNEIRNRISALALIYDKLYRSEVFNQINLNEYISSLLSSLQQSFLPGSRDIVELSVDNIYVDNKVAVPIALLINELVSNAFMHAFPYTEFPKLQLSLKRETDVTIKLVVADNGVGLPEGIEIVKGKTFGFKLIDLFARQLKGKVHYTNSHGFRIEVEFQNMQHEVRN